MFHLLLFPKGYFIWLTYVFIIFMEVLFKKKWPILTSMQPCNPSINTCTHWLLVTGTLWKLHRPVYSGGSHAVLCLQHTHTHLNTAEREHTRKCCAMCLNRSEGSSESVWHTHTYTLHSQHTETQCYTTMINSEFDCVCMRVVASQYMDTLQCFPEDRVVGVAQVCKYYFCTCKAFPAGRFLCVCRHYTGSRGLSMYNNLNSCIHQNLAWLLTSRSVGSPPNILNC